MLFSFALLRPDVGVGGNLAPWCGRLEAVWFPGGLRVRLPNLFSPFLQERGYPQGFSTVWRTYTRVILSPCEEGMVHLKNSER